MSSHSSLLDFYIFILHFVVRETFLSRILNISSKVYLSIVSVINVRHFHKIEIHKPKELIKFNCFVKKISFSLVSTISANSINLNFACVLFWKYYHLHL